jgi:ribosomal protein S18 acetylase RimI-like enzyme
MIMGDVRIRPYEARDRARVRHICFVTGYIGEPVEWQWRDPESFSDIFSGYYTDAEPESALVAEVDGEVRGYLLGCVDSTRAWNPATVVGRQITRRGIAFRPGTARFVWRSVGDVIVDAAHKRLPPAPFADPRWPAHVHIDLLRDARGRGVGMALMRRWLETLRSKGVPGCYLETIAENTGAIAFFEAMGFEKRRRPIPAPGLRSPRRERHHLQLMVQSLQVGSEP